ncbi:cytochrome c [Janthinobacterium sp.]|uniref:c-type cytochrome n=1 Tax=Janthinobacterium sp. TaxID=1871054 RepID=UPI002896565B|nr:cytochrome c [Janthinobacterium sp.]
MMRRFATMLTTAALALGVAMPPAHAQSAPPVTLTPDRPAAPAPAANGQDARLERGRYLAIAADCMACHTAASGKPYAGGYAIDSPLGTIYATNITPSKKGGIGHYTEAEFARALRQGVRADGSHLYPAMPYTSYALLTDADVGDLYHYFMHAVQPVDEPARQTKLPFPFNIRLSMMGWNALFLDNKRFVPDAGKSAQINRGAYLSEGLAHCSACHTPRNMLMAEVGSQKLAGADLGSWHAPNITSDKISGIGGWTDVEIAAYLKTGHVEGKGQAAGGMAEAIQNSLQFLHDDDVAAIVAYLRTVPPVRAAGQQKAAFSHGSAISEEAGLRGMASATERHSLNSGAVLFSGYCASCHSASGAGSTGQAYPALFHNTATGAETPANLVSAILFGVERKIGKEGAEVEAFMPRFDQRSYVQSLTDEQIASIANYVLKQYGNPAVSVTPAYVAQARSGGEKPVLARLPHFIVPVGVAALLVLIALLVWWRSRRQSKD